MKDWPRTRLKYVTEANSSVLPEDTPSDFEFTYVNIGNVTQGVVDIASAPITFLDAPSRARRLAQPGDSVVSTVRTYLRAVATVPEADRPVVFSTGFAVLHPIDGVLPRYLSWYLQGDEFVARVEAHSTGVSYPAITATQLVALDLRLPPLPVQHAIADFLDRETARIDTLIDEQQRLIELLRERNAACIDDAFRGIPERAPLGYLADDITVGIVVQPSRWYADVGVPALRGTNIRPGTIATNDLVFLSEEGHAANAKSALREGDVVVVRTGQAGAAAVVPPALDGANAIDVLIVRPGRRVSAGCLAWYLNSPTAAGLIQHGSVGALQGHFNVSSLRALPYPSVSGPEQAQIAGRLDAEGARIDTLIAETHRFIALARERRTALITAAVTGQIDVREAEPVEVG